MKSQIITILIILLFGLPAFVQENSKLLTGKVIHITADCLTVQTKDKEERIALTKETKFDKDGTRTTLETVKAGSTVMIETDQSAGALTARSVRFRSELRLDLRNPKYPPAAKNKDGH